MFAEDVALVSAALNKKRMFYIEDDAKNRTIMQMVLEMHGVRLAFDQWGMTEVLLSRINLFRPDLILLDLMLPMRLSGYDVYRTLSADPHLAKIPVVIVSASDPAIEVPKAKALGLAGYISKPIDIRTFPRLLTMVLEGKPIWSVS